MRLLFWRRTSNRFPRSPPFFKVTLVWLSNAELNVFIDEFTIPFVANVSDAIRISVVFFFSLLLSLFRQL